MPLLTKTSGERTNRSGLTLSDLRLDDLVRLLFGRRPQWRTWGKLGVETPKFVIESDATIVAPLIFAWVLASGA